MTKTFEELTDEEIEAKLQEELKDPTFKEPKRKFNLATLSEEPILDKEELEESD